MAIVTDYSELPVVLSPNDVATKVLGCSREKVYGLLEAGDMPGSKFGSRWSIPRSALVRWMDEQAEAQAEQRQQERRPILQRVK